MRAPICIDRDLDGFFVGPDCTGTLDCDDSDTNVTPNAHETCGDGIDNDCNGVVDDGCPCSGDIPVGETRACGTGACAGAQTCEATGWSECWPAVLPEEELCGPRGTGDGIDQDCDGAVDERCTTPDAG